MAAAAAAAGRIAGGQRGRRRVSRGPSRLTALPNDLLRQIALQLPAEDVARFGVAATATRQAVASLPPSYHRQELWRTLSHEFHEDLYGVGYDPSIGVV